MNPKSSTSTDDDRLTPKDERSLAFGVAQGKAGLTYGPFEEGDMSLRAFIKARERTRRVSIRIPAVPQQLMACILQIHQFKDRDRQLILLAVDRAASNKRKSSKSKLKKL